VSLLCTDQWVGYNGLGKDFPHATVDHAKGQYVVGAVHTQTIEGLLVDLQARRNGHVS
jgi:hypothetical protein